MGFFCGGVPCVGDRVEDARGGVDHGCADDADFGLAFRGTLAHRRSSVLFPDHLAGGCIQGVDLVGEGRDIDARAENQRLAPDRRSQVGRLPGERRGDRVDRVGISARARPIAMVGRP